MHTWYRLFGSRSPEQSDVFPISRWEGHRQASCFLSISTVSSHFHRCRLGCTSPNMHCLNCARNHRCLSLAFNPVGRSYSPDFRTIGPLESASKPDVQVVLVWMLTLSKLPVLHVFLSLIHLHSNEHNLYVWLTTRLWVTLSLLWTEWADCTSQTGECKCQK